MLTYYHRPPTDKCGLRICGLRVDTVHTDPYIYTLLPVCENTLRTPQKLAPSQIKMSLMSTELKTELKDISAYLEETTQINAARDLGLDDLRKVSRKLDITGLCLVV